MFRPAATQIRNSNTYSLAAQVQAAGGEPVLLPIAPDEPGRLRELIADGLESDCCCWRAESPWASTIWSNRSWQNSRQNFSSPERKFSRESR